MADLVKADPSTGMDDIIKLFQGLNFGEGTKTATTTPGTDAMEAQRQLLSQIMAGQDPATIDAMVSNILTQAQEKFAPAIGASKAAGNRAYSDSTLQYMGNIATARATGEAAAAKLNAITASQRTAAGLVDSAMQNTKTTVTKQAPSLGTKLAGTGLAGVSLYSKLKGKKPGTSTADLSNSDIGNNLDKAFSSDEVAAASRARDVATSDAISINNAIASPVVNAGGAIDAISPEFSIDQFAEAGDIPPVADIGSADLSVPDVNATDITGDTDISDFFSSFFDFADGGKVMAKPSFSKKRMTRSGYADGGIVPGNPAIGSVSLRSPTGYDPSLLTSGTSTFANDVPSVSSHNNDPMVHATNAANLAKSGGGIIDLASADLANVASAGIGAVGTEPGPFAPVGIPLGPVGMFMTAVQIAYQIAKNVDKLDINNPVNTVDVTDAVIGPDAPVGTVAGTDVGPADTGEGEGTPTDSNVGEATPSDSNIGEAASTSDPGDPGDPGASADAGAPGDASEADGGKLDGKGDGSGIDDKINIKASQDEYIVPADIIRKVPGVEEFLDHLIETYHVPAAQQRRAA